VDTPKRTKTYRNQHLDSTRWDHVRFQPDDIVVTTSLKSGTTWMQRILSLLVLGPDPLARPLSSISPWIDAAFAGDIDSVVANIEAQDHRRFVKSHLPFDALPYDPDVRYVYVGRDTRDVFMSLYNHYSGYTDLMYGLLDRTDPSGRPMPRCPDTPRELWADWITRGAFDWEDDGWPYWSHHHHGASYWRHRELPNVLMVHYADLLDDLEGQMRRVAAFVGIEVAEEAWPELVAPARFEAMKKEASGNEVMMPVIWQGGAERFFFKGTNGRWHDVLTDDDIALYETAATRLDPGFRRWLER
jgi:aryl sulfotransferase